MPRQQILNVCQESKKNLRFIETFGIESTLKNKTFSADSELQVPIELSEAKFVHSFELGPDTVTVTVTVTVN
jgi:hypothetical protein